MRDPHQVIRGFDRPEIHPSVRAFRRAGDKRQAVLDAVREQAGSGLVYTATRKDAEGERVEHREWGPGLAIEAERDRLTVLFDEYGYRELATQVASRRHLLAPA